MKTKKTSDEKKRYRVVVCGSGIIGLTTCLYLSRKGYEVICLDRESGVSQQTSFCNGAFLDPSLFQSWASPDVFFKMLQAPFSGKRPSSESPMKIKFNVLGHLETWSWGFRFLFNCLPQRSLVNSRKLRNLGFYSMKEMQFIQNQYPGKLEMDQGAQGTLEIFRSTKEAQNGIHSKRIQDLGDQVQVLNSNQSQQVEPEILPDAFSYGSILSPSGTSGDVYKFSVQLQKICIDLGVQFLFNWEISRFQMDPDNPNVITAVESKDGKTIQGNHFVLALGNETNEMTQQLGLHFPMLSVKGYVLTLPTTSNSPSHNIYDGGNVLIAPLRNDLRISGIVDLQGKDYSVDPNRAFWLLQESRRLLKHDDYSQMKTHTCLRPVSPDDVPYIGKSKKYSNLYINTGHGSKGWTLAFGSGKLLADYINGEVPELDIQLYSPDRFSSIFH